MDINILDTILKYTKGSYEYYWYKMYFDIGKVVYGTKENRIVSSNNNSLSSYSLSGEKINTIKLLPRKYNSLDVILPSEKIMLGSRELSLDEFAFL